MSGLRALKEDLERLKKAFPKTHTLFRVSSATLDEVNFKFVGGTYSVDITATIMPCIYQAEARVPILEPKYNG